jgi:hypothetical protein
MRKVDRLSWKSVYGYRASLSHTATAAAELPTFSLLDCSTGSPRSYRGRAGNPQGNVRNAAMSAAHRSCPVVGWKALWKKLWFPSFRLVSPIRSERRRSPADLTADFIFKVRSFSFSTVSMFWRVLAFVLWARGVRAVHMENRGKSARGVSQSRRLPSFGTDSRADILPHMSAWGKTALGNESTGNENFARHVV